MQLRRLRDTVMIGINPDAEPRIHRVFWRDPSIVVSAVVRLIKDGKGSEPITVLSLGRIWLFGLISKEFTEVINITIVISIEDEPSILRCSDWPCHLIFHICMSKHVKPHTSRRVTQMKAASICIDNDGADYIVATASVRVFVGRTAISCI